MSDVIAKLAQQRSRELAEFARQELQFITPKMDHQHVLNIALYADWVAAKKIEAMTTDPAVIAAFVLEQDDAGV